MKKYAFLVLCLLAILSIDVGQQLRVNGTTATVERGPDWLAVVLHQPPDWIIPVIIGLMAIIVIVAAIGYRRSTVSTELKLEIAANVLTLVVAAMLITLFNQLHIPYLLAVPIAGIGGHLIAVAIVKELHASVKAKNPV